MINNIWLQKKDKVIVSLVMHYYYPFMLYNNSGDILYKSQYAADIDFTMEQVLINLEKSVFVLGDSYNICNVAKVQISKIVGYSVDAEIKTFWGFGPWKKLTCYKEVNRGEKLFDVDYQIKYEFIKPESKTNYERWIEIHNLKKEYREKAGL